MSTKKLAGLRKRLEGLSKVTKFWIATYNPGMAPTRYKIVRGDEDYFDSNNNMVAAGIKECEVMVNGFIAGWIAAGTDITDK